MIKVLNLKLFTKYIFFLTIFLVPIIEIFYPFITNQIIIINEFLDIPISSSFEIKDKTTSISPIYLNASIDSLHLAYKTLIGYFFHHHMNFLIPSFELYENFNTSIHQYGILTSIITGGLCKLLFGNISLASYFSVLYSMYIIFYTLIFYLIWIILKNKILLIPASLLLYLFLYIVGFESYYMTPTLNPIRQLLFPVIFLLCFYYFKDYNSKKYNKILLLIIISYFINSQFTLLFILSLIILKVGLFLIYKLNENQKKHLKLTIFLFIILIGLNISYSFNYSNSFSEYFIILGPVLDINSYVFLLFFISVLPSICIRLWKGENFEFVTLVSIYFSLSMIYYVWNPSMNHFSPISWPWVIIVILYCDEIYHEKILVNYQSFIVLLVAFALICYEARANFYIAKKNYYDKTIEVSQVFNWDTENSQIKSTIDDIYINDACNLFEKYSDKKNITMLSLHDSYLPFVCGYSNKNYSMQVGLNLPTKKEERELISYYEKTSVETIFVDNLLLNIEENSEYDLTLIQVSSIVGIDKIIHLKYFSDLVKKIITKYDYRLIEKGKKLSVFKRKVIADEN